MSNLTAVQLKSLVFNAVGRGAEAANASPYRLAWAVVKSGLCVGFMQWETVFDCKHAFYDKVKQAGNDVTLMEVEGRGAERHSTTYVTYRVAGLCARDMPLPVITDQGVGK